ncbi:MAG: ABC transporter ATP-binding protein/permease [Microscillaceae bacterium]|nr:ABC transporter ATP-binding protein/permease [Microscillaceae bacterium]MDW8461934.1 ABC transporter ATP-binding protein [Cytophagales bacterium]
MAELEQPTQKIIDWYNIQKILFFARPYKKWFFFLVILTITSAALAPLRPYLVQYTIDHYVYVGDYLGLALMSGITIIILLLQSYFQYLYTYLSSWVGQTIIKDIRITLYRHILNLRLRFYDKTPIGKLVTRNISDVETLSNVFSEGLAALVGDVLQIVLILALMFYTHWQLTLVSLALLPLLIISTYIFKEKVKKAFDETRAAVANLNAFVQEHITGMAIVQIFGSEKNEYQKFQEINHEHRRANLKAVLYYSVYFPVAEVIGAGGTGLLIWYGANEVLAEEITLGVLIAFIMYISLFFRPIRMIADRFNTLQMGIVSMDRIVKLLDNDEVTPNEGKLKPNNLKGKIQFENVWFAYNDKDFVLKNISFEVEAGQTVALVGATGAGKSSVINLLSRFYDIQQGRILIDNHDIRHYDLAYLRKHISVVLQDVFLFSGSVLDNITLGNEEISFETVLHAAELVGAREFIEKLPNGFDYNVMERGATLSVGQRQLISFVRAMVYEPKILILDEATSSVDTETEELIQQAIAKMMRGRTAIVIAHRLSTIQNADKIIVLDKGEIKEIGSHDELLARNGYYYQLYQMQYKEVAAKNSKVI